MSGGIIALIVVAALLFVAIILVSYVIAVYNGLVKMRNNVDEAFSTIDVYLKKRYDLIPNLVETVKGYAKHEKETLEKVMQARYNAMSANEGSVENRFEKENILTGTLKSLFAVTENYPDLKANTNFQDMMRALKEIEMEIANSRKYYNGCVKQYNIKREIFPSSIIAKWFKFEKRALYEIEDKEERKNVKVEF